MANHETPDGVPEPPVIDILAPQIVAGVAAAEGQEYPEDAAQALDISLSLNPEEPLFDGGPNIAEAYAAYKGFTERCFKRKLGSSAMVEDMTQTAFIRLWGRQGKLRKATNLYEYLSTIATNLTYDASRSNGRQVRTFGIREADFDASTRAVSSNNPTPEEIVTAGTFSPEVEHALASMNPDFRATLLACDVEGLTYEECAQKLNIKLGTVRSRISRARDIFRANYVAATNAA